MSNWKNPEKELPENGQRVWVILRHTGKYPIKEACEIVCGETSHRTNSETGSKSVIVENHDDLGQGWQWWVLSDEDDDSSFEKAYAWMPVEDMDWPEWVDVK